MTMVEDYKHAFDDVKVCFFEDLKKDKRLFLSDISSFMGIVSISNIVEDRIVNKALSSTAIKFLITISRISNLINIKIPYSYEKKPLNIENNNRIIRILRALCNSSFWFNYQRLRKFWQLYIDKIIYLDFKIKSSDIFTKDELIMFKKDYKKVIETIKD